MAPIERFRIIRDGVEDSLVETGLRSVRAGLIERGLAEQFGDVVRTFGGDALRAHVGTRRESILSAAILAAAGTEEPGAAAKRIAGEFGAILPPEVHRIVAGAVRFTGSPRIMAAGG